MTDPFAPAPAPSQPGPGANALPCAQCGTLTDPARMSYSGTGEKICPRCEANETIDVGDMRAAHSIFGGGIGAFSTGMLSFCINPLWLFSILAIASGIGTLIIVARHPEYRVKMGWRYGATLAFAILGIMAGLAGCLSPGFVGFARMMS